MKRRLILPVILLSLAVLSGCGKKTEAPEDGQTEVEEVKEPEKRTGGLRRTLRLP